MKKLYTLAFLIKENSICLALKKRGFGQGYWNGYGGKLEDGETVEACAVREIREESGVSVKKAVLEKVAINEFFFHGGKQLKVHVFFIRDWIGEPKETEEMKPKWVFLDAIPYDKMWAADPHWLPRVLLGEKLRGKVWFKEDEKTIEKMEWTLAQNL